MNENKQFYIKIDGQPIEVTEEVYRAYKRPAWTERKRRQVRAEQERSLEMFLESGMDVQSDERLVDEIVEDKMMLDTLLTALDELTDGEQVLIKKFFFENKSEREVANEIGVPRNTVVYRRNKALTKLKKIFEKK